MAHMTTALKYNKCVPVTQSQLGLRSGKLSFYLFFLAEVTKTLGTIESWEWGGKDKKDILQNMKLQALAFHLCLKTINQKKHCKFGNVSIWGLRIYPLQMEILVLLFINDSLAVSPL